MSSLPIEMVPHSRDDLRGDLPDAHGPTAADMLTALADIRAWLNADAHLSARRLLRFELGLDAIRDFILAHPADLPPADRATAQPPAAEVNGDDR